MADPRLVEAVADAIHAMYHGAAPSTATAAAVAAATGSGGTFSVQPPSLPAALPAAAPSGAATQSAAIAWLVEFQESADAWAVWSALLSSPRAPDVQYYAANCLAAKVAAEWSRLSAADCDALYHQLWALLDGLVAAGAQLPTLGRLCRGVATCVALTPAVLPSLLARLTAAATTALTPGAAGARAALVTTVECARAVADAVDDTQLAGARKDAMAAVLAVEAPAALALLAQLVVADASALRADDALLASALAAVAGWLHLGAVTPGALAASQPALLAALPALLATTASAAVAGAAADAIETLLAAAAAPAAAADGRAAAVATLAGVLLSSAGAVRAAIAARAQALLSPLAAVLVAVAKHDAEWLVGDGAAAPPPPDVEAAHFPATAAALDADGSGLLAGAPVGVGVLLAEMALQVAAARCLPAAEAVLDFFTPIHATPVASRHPALRAPLFRALLRCLLAQVAYPLPGDGSVAAEDFLAYRSATSAVGDALADAFTALQGAYVVEAAAGALACFDALAAARTGDATPAGALAAMMAPTPLDAAAGMPTWQPLEAALFCLHAVGDDLCELLEDSDIDAASGDSAAAEYVAALAYYLTTTLPPAAMAPELAAMAARWLGGLHRWLPVALACTPDALRAATLFTQQSPAAAGVEASIMLLPTTDLLHAILGFLTPAMAAVASVGVCSRRPRPERMAACLAFLESDARARALAACDAGADDGDDGGDDDGGGAGGGGGGGGGGLGEVREDGKIDTDTVGVTATCAAVALARIVRACRRHLVSDTAVKHLADGLAAACDAGLSAFAAAVVLRQLLGLAASLPPASAGAALHYFLDPPVARLADMAAFLAAHASEPGAVTPAAEVAVAKEAVLVFKALQSAAAEGGGVTGMGDLTVADIAASPLGRAAAAAALLPPASPLAFVVDALWPHLEAALPAVHDRPALVAVLIALARRFMRVHPAGMAPALPRALELGVALYSAHLYPEALLLAEAAVAALPLRDGGDAAAAAAVDAVHHALAAAATALYDAAGTPADAAAPGGASLLAAQPDAATAFFSFARAVLDVAPAAAMADDVLRVCIPAVGFVVQLWDRQVATAAAEFVSTLFFRRDADAHYEAPVLAAIVAHGEALMSSLLAALLDDRGANVAHAVTTIVLRMLASYGDKGATAVLLAALEDYAATTLEAESARWGVTLEDLARQETGILSLSPDERRDLVAVATAWAADDAPRARMLLGDIAAICKRAQTKDVLLAYLLPPRGGRRSGGGARGGGGGAGGRRDAPAEQRYLTFEDD